MKPAGESARADWEARLGRRSEAAAVTGTHVEAPQGLLASQGRGQVTLAWQPVPGAVGYVILRAATRDGPFEPIDTGKPDVMAVPGPPFADTTGAPGAAAWYAVAGIWAAGAGPGDPGILGERSEPVEATPVAGGHASVVVEVDASRTVGSLARPWRPIIGSEHLSQLAYGEGPGGRKMFRGSIAGHWRNSPRPQ